MNDKPDDMETDQDDQLNTEQSVQNNETKSNGGDNEQGKQDNEADLTDENLSIKDPENDLDEEEVSRLFPGRETDDTNPYDVESEDNKAADNEGAAAYNEEDMKGTPGYGDDKPESGGYNEDPNQQKVGE